MKMKSEACLTLLKSIATSEVRRQVLREERLGLMRAACAVCHSVLGVEISYQIMKLN